MAPSSVGKPLVMTSPPPNHFEEEFRREMLMTPPVASPMLAGIPPVTTCTSSMADFGRALDPRTLIPSMYTHVDDGRAPRMEMPPPVPAVLAPATVVAMDAAERPGILSMSSRVMVPPDAPPSLSINGTVYSTTSASSIMTPAESSAFTNWILFAVILTPVIFWLWYPTKLTSTSYVPG